MNKAIYSNLNDNINNYHSIANNFLIYISFDWKPSRDSFGYDCARRRNLAVLDEVTIFFVTGNLLHFLDLEENELSMHRSISGSGISCIAVSLL